jgi:hypothetical protein
LQTTGRLVIEETKVLKVVYCIWFVQSGSSSNNSKILQRL